MAVQVNNSDLDARVRVVQLSGRLDMETADADTPLAMQALEESGAGVIFDMAEVDFLSSSGIRLLVVAYKTAQSSGKHIALIRTPPAVYMIFEMASLDSVFRFFDDEAEAIRGIWGGA